MTGEFRTWVLASVALPSSACSELSPHQQVLVGGQAADQRQSRGPALPQRLQALPSGMFSGLPLPASLQGIDAGMVTRKGEEVCASVYGKSVSPSGSTIRPSGLLSLQLCSSGITSLNIKREADARLQAVHSWA